MYQQPGYANPGFVPPQPLDSARKGLSIASLILGIVGLFTRGIFGIGDIIGVTLGFMALNKTNKNPREYGGKGFAIAGVITNILSLVLIIFVGMISAIAIPNLLAARRTANTASAVSILHIVHNAQISYQIDEGNGNFAERLGYLGRFLYERALGMQKTPRNGYLLGEIVVSPQTRNSEAKYSVIIRPAVRKGIVRTGDDSFFIDETGVVRHSGDPSVDADESSPPLGDS